MRLCLCFLMLLFLVTRPGEAASAAGKALSVWGLEIAPSLFPYMVYCRLVAAELQKSGLPAAPCVCLLGLLGGSPSGASVLAVYAGRGSLSGSARYRLAALTGTISPMFFLSTLRLWTGSALFNHLLLCAHFIGTLCAWAGACLLTRRHPEETGPVLAPFLPENPITGSVQSILAVGGCIVFFSVTAAGLRALIPGMSGLTSAALHAALEISGGLHSLCGLALPPIQKAVWLAAASGMTGLSILTQNALVLKPCGIRFKDLLLFALLRAAGAGMAMRVLFPLFFL